MSDIRMGVVGIGRIGKMHVENINKLIEGLTVTAVADPMLDSSKDWVKAQGIPFTTEDYRELLARDDVDAVLIACSTALHHEICLAAAAAGKHIFCEKPLDLTIAHCEEMVEACKNAGVKLQVGFNRRFDHNFKKVREAVEKGIVGEPHIVRIASRDPAAPPIEYVRVSGGIFIDMTIHDFDMMRYVSGSDVEEVYVTGAVLVDPAIGEAGDVDTAVVTLKLANGAIGIIDNSRQAVYGYDQRVEVFGSKGQALADNDRFTTVQIATADDTSLDKIPHFFLDRYTQAFLDEFRGFVDCINNDTAPLVDGNDGMQAVKIALAATKSFKEGRPVKLSEIR